MQMFGNLAMRSDHSMLAALVAVLFSAWTLPSGATPIEDGERAAASGDYGKAGEVWRISAEQGDADAQFLLGNLYDEGRGVPQDYSEAIRWYRLSADQGHAPAQNNLAEIYRKGSGVPKDVGEAVKWFTQAAEHGYAPAQANLGAMYGLGLGYGPDGAPDRIRAYKWLSLAAAAGFETAATVRDDVAARMTTAQIVEAQRLAREWKPKDGLDWRETEQSAASARSAQNAAPTSGTGFFVNNAGFAVTNAHVVDGCTSIEIAFVEGGTSRATLLGADVRNDLAVLKVAGPAPTYGKFRIRPAVRQGEPVITYGFPLVGALASRGNLSAGNVTALAGLADDTSQFQISVPVQPGNSGGPLLDDSGLVIGVVSSKLNAIRAALVTGDIPQNVNFAIKSSVVSSFLDTNGIEYQSATRQGQWSVADVGDQAKAFTFLVRCIP
jgi:uncharacterized protein